MLLNVVPQTPQFTWNSSAESGSSTLLSLSLSLSPSLIAIFLIFDFLGELLLDDFLFLIDPSATCDFPSSSSQFGQSQGFLK